MNKIKEFLKIKSEMVRSVEWRTSVFPRLVTSLAVCAVMVYFVAYYAHEDKHKPKLIAPENRSAFEGVSLDAKSAVVWDMQKGKMIFEKNADEPLPLASVTKVMTALVAQEVYSKSKSFKDIKIHKEDIAVDGDSGLLLNTHWNLESMIDYSLLVSSNDGASAIASAYGSVVSATTSDDAVIKNLFINKMNTEAKRIGLVNSRFMNEHGLDRGEDSVGAFGSAKDMAVLFQYILKNYPDLLEATKYSHLTFKDEDGFVYNANNTNIASDLIPSLIASKTGFTDLAGGNLVIAFDAGLNHPVIISVLGSTREDRFADTLSLVNATMKYIQDN